jgi:enoyl-CoA hydratase
MSVLLYERLEDVATLQLNRPERLNALSAELIGELLVELERLAEDETLKALVLTGEGRAFCAGTDLNELEGRTEQQALEISERGAKLCDRIEGFPVPVITAINGPAIGGGLEIVLASHIRIASETATFGLPETRLGVIPGYGGSQRLPREIGVGWASELMLTGRSLTALEAERLGLLNRVVSQGSVMSEAMSVANEVAKLAPLAVRACLKAVTVGVSLPIDQGLQLERELFASLFATEDMREGTRAFLEKRRPVFKGK